VNKLIFMLAWRYLIGTKNENNISTMVLVCFLGILIGSFSLAIVASVMNGFEQVTHKKIQSIHPQIIINSNNQKLMFEKISSVLKKEFPSIQAISPSIQKQAIIKGDDDDEYNILAIKGIAPLTENSVSNIEKKIISSISKEKKLSAILKNNKILIGERLAKSFEVVPGEKISLLFSKEDNIKKRKIKMEEKDVTIGGIFKTGIDDFDSNLIICSLSLTEKLFPESGITQINLKLKTNCDEYKVVKQLKDRLKIDVYSWKELYPALVQALKLEKYAMFFILAIITLVASMNIISLLFMQITQKRPDIAILKAIGLSHKKISRIFLYLGMTVSLIGASAGLMLAFIVGHLLEKYPFIKLPDAYYVTHLPSKMEWQIFVAVFAVVIVLSLVSIWIPTRKTRSINIANVLRFEG